MVRKDISIMQYRPKEPTKPINSKVVTRTRHTIFPRTPSRNAQISGEDVLSYLSLLIRTLPVRVAPKREHIRQPRTAVPVRPPSQPDDDRPGAPAGDRRPPGAGPRH